MDCVTCSIPVCRERDKRIGLNMTPSNTTPLLSVRNLRDALQTSHGQLEAMRGVDFEMQRGDTLGLIGESGCGKTTLGRAILQLVPTTSGKIILNDEELKIHSVHNAKELGISAVFQEFSLVPQLTVEENLF